MVEHPSAGGRSDKSEVVEPKPVPEELKGTPEEVERDKQQQIERQKEIERRKQKSPEQLVEEQKKNLEQEREARRQRAEEKRQESLDHLEAANKILRDFGGMTSNIPMTSGFWDLMNHHRAAHEEWKQLSQSIA